MRWFAFLTAAGCAADAPAPADEDARCERADASFTAPGLRLVPGGSGDLDADGDAELLLGVQGCDSAELHVVTGPFAGASDLDAATMGLYQTSYVADAAFTADLNGNGFEDVAVGNGSSTWLLFGGPGM